MLTADDRALLREVFTWARAAGVARKRLRWAGSVWDFTDLDRGYEVRLEIVDDESFQLTVDHVARRLFEGWPTSVTQAVDALAAVGVLPMRMSSVHRAAEKMAYDAVHGQIKLQVAEWYDDLQAPVERGWAKAEKAGYLKGVSEAIDGVCNVIGVEYPLWDDMREVAQ